MFIPPSGVHTQGKTIAEVKENLQKAIAMVVESNLRHFVERIGEYEEYFEEDLAVTL